MSVSFIDGHIDNEKMTNYDRIRNMSVEEFSRFLKKISDCEDNLCNECPITCCKSAKGIEQWLKSGETEDINQWLESEVTEE
jgi:hypothetical protein